MQQINISARKGRLSKAVNRISYPFIKEIVTLYKKRFNKINYNEARDYYYSILMESYDQRNLFIHEGVENEKAVVKLDMSLPYVVIRFRWILFSEMKNIKP